MKEVEQKNPKNERLVAKSRGGKRKKRGHELKGRVENDGWMDGWIEEVNLNIES